MDPGNHHIRSVWKGGSDFENPFILKAAEHLPGLDNMPSIAAGT